jgi:hypothetical protein
VSGELQTRTATANRNFLTADFADDADFDRDGAGTGRRHGPRSIDRRPRRHERQLPQATNGLTAIKPHCRITGYDAVVLSFEIGAICEICG